MIQYKSHDLHFLQWWIENRVVLQIPAGTPDFEKIKAAEGSYKRNMQLVDLMNELERDYDTFKIGLSVEGLAELLANNEAVSLYQEISAARTYED